MNSENNGIVIAGSLIADTSYTIDTYPREGMLTQIRENIWNVGGSGNLILDLAKLDSELPVHVSAIIGNDDSGNRLLSILGSYPNISLENIRVEGSSSVTVVMNAQDTKQRTFFFLSGGSGRYNENYINWDTINAKIFHLEYLLLLDSADGFDDEYGTRGAKILSQAQSRGMKTSIDMVSEQSTRAKHVVTAALRYTDYCSINEVEAELVTGIPVLVNGNIDESNVKSALVALESLGVSTWAVIHSPEASFGYDCQKKEFVKVPSLQLPENYIKGSTGAGDAYCCGFLYGAYHDWSLEKAMILGTACAACSLSEMNGTDGLRPLEEVMKEYNLLQSKT